MAFPRGQGGPVDQCPGPIANRAAGAVKAVCHGSYGKIAGLRPARPRHPSSFMQLIPESDPAGRGPVATCRRPRIVEIGRAHVSTPVTNAHCVCRLLLEK